jgi:predicted acylesterase/phospholipase RssA/CRP-like cAMP-binding protein
VNVPAVGELSGLIESIPLFAGLDEEVRARLSERAERVSLAAGEWLFHGGDRGDSMYLVAAGRVDIVLERDAPVVVRELAAGDWLGELALLTHQPRSASVRARRDSVLVRLAAEDFDAVTADPKAALGLARYLAGQLQNSRALDSDEIPIPSAITLVPLAPDLPAGEVAAAIAQELGRTHPAELLASPAGGPTQDPAELLERVEHDGGQLLMVAEPDYESDWSARCLRQSDALVLLGGSGTVPPMPRGGPGSRDSHLLMPGAVLDSGGAVGWLDAAPDARLTRADEVGAAAATVARKLAGRSLGIVLSGGGARALAHIGVLQELVAAGMRIDRVGGVSMGSVVGALFAMGHTPEEIEDLCRREFARTNILGDYTVPIYSFVRGGRARRSFQRLFGDRRIETLTREFFCTSCDLFGSEAVVHRRGSLLLAVGASSSLPGIVPPVVDETGLVLVDGGVLNNLPVETMAGAGHGPVIASDVSATQEARNPAAAGLRRPRLRRFAAGARRLVSGTEGPLPRGPETVVRSIVLGSVDTAAEAREHATFSITPDVRDFAITDFHAIDELVERGRAAARVALASAGADL